MPSMFQSIYDTIRKVQQPQQQAQPAAPNPQASGGLFPTLSGFLGKRTPQGQQQQNPMQYQQMPNVMPKQQGNEQFNLQQQMMNRGKMRRGMGRM